MLLIESEDNKIHIFGRDDNGVATHVIDYNFEPYFYIDDCMGVNKSIFDNKVSKLKVKNKNHVRFLSEKYDTSYESKVKYENRYIIDSYNDIKEEQKRICYLDIECKMEHEFNVFKALNMITSICCYDNFLHRYMVVSLRNNEKNLNSIRKKNATIIFCDSEYELLNTFIKYIKETDPDILMAFNGYHFDFPYIIRRMITCSINYSSLSRMNIVIIDDNNKVKIKGRILLDALPMYRHIEQGEREKYSLDYLSQYEGLGEKLDYDGNLDDLFNTDIWKFIKYNKRDVKLLRLLDEKKKLTYYYDVIRRMAKCQFEDIISNMRVVESFILSYAKNHNLVVPVLTGGKKDKKNEGAFVMKPVPKLYSNISVADAKSLYPSIIRQFNMSPETLVLQKEIDEGKFKKEDLICVGNGCFFRKDKKGLLPEILGVLANHRDECKVGRYEAKKKYGIDSVQYKTMDSLQYAVKVIMNSVSGDTLVPVSKKGSNVIEYKKIKSLEKNYKNYKTLVNIPNTNQFDWFDITDFIKEIPNDNKVKKIIIENGNSIEISNNHSIYIFRNDEEIMVKGSDLELGDFVVCFDKGLSHKEFDKQYFEITRFVERDIKKNEFLYDLTVPPYYDFMGGKVDDNFFRLRDSFYGVLGNPYFFLFTNEIADSILFVEREFIEYTIDRTKDYNRKTIYGDTDSIFILFDDYPEVNDDMILEFNTLVDNINKTYTKFCNDRNIDKNDYFILQPEKIYKKIFFGEAKKRYAGILVWKDGKYIENPKVSVTGFEVVRSDYPQIFRDFQSKMFTAILEYGNKEETDKVLNNFVDEFYNFSADKICFPKGIGITFLTNTSSVHFKSSHNANLYCNAGIKSGDKIKWGYVKKTPKGIPYCDVIAFKDNLYDGWEIDYNKHAEKMITDKIKGIYNCLNWDFKIQLKDGEIDLFS